MACSDSKCPIRKEGERQITCWLCDKLFHMKCVGLLSRTTDQLMDSSLGLRWCCSKCRGIDVEFYRFFTGTHRELREMKNEFVTLFEKFRRFEELFTKFGHLDAVLHSKGVSGSSALGGHKDVERGKGLGGDVSPVNVDSAVGSCSVSINSAGLSVPKPTDLITLSPNSPLSPPRPNVSASTALLPGCTNISSGLSIPDNASKIVQWDADGVSVPSNVSAPKDLVVVKPKKVIFVSRLSCDTSVEDIVHYVKSRVNVPFEFDCYKLKPSLNRSISSFKIFVPGDRFDSIVKPAFWPQGIIVREFVFRENNRSRGVALPTVSSRKN